MSSDCLFSDLTSPEYPPPPTPTELELLLKGFETSGLTSQTNHPPPPPPRIGSSHGGLEIGADFYEFGSCRTYWWANELPTTPNENVLATAPPPAPIKMSDFLHLECGKGPPSLLENLGMSKPSISILQKLKFYLGVLQIKYNYIVLFLDKCVGCLFMIENRFSHRLPL